MYCRECGSKVRDDQKFCRNCGRPVTRNKQNEPGKPKIVKHDDKDDHPSRDMDKDRYRDRDGDRDRDSDRDRPFRDQQQRTPSPICPKCNGRLKFMKQYNEYWCDPCQMYPFKASTQTGNSGTARALYGLSLFTSIVGGIMLLVFDFGSWHNYNYYYKMHTWGHIGPDVSPLAFIAFFLVAFGLFFCSMVSIQGVRKGAQMKRNLVMGSLISALAVLIVMIIGAVSFFVFVDAQDIGLEAGFYGGAIGSLLTTIFLGLNLKHTIKKPPIPYPGHMGYQQQYPPRRR